MVGQDPWKIVVCFWNWKGQWWRNVAPFSPPDSEFDEVFSFVFEWHFLSYWLAVFSSPLQLANLITTQECQDCMKGVLAKMKWTHWWNKYFITAIFFGWASERSLFAKNILPWTPLLFGSFLRLQEEFWFSLFFRDCVWGRLSLVARCD